MLKGRREGKGGGGGFKNVAEADGFCATKIRIRRIKKTTENLGSFFEMIHHCFVENLTGIFYLFIYFFYSSLFIFTSRLSAAYSSTYNYAHCMAIALVSRSRLLHVS